MEPSQVEPSPEEEADPFGTAWYWWVLAVFWAFLVCIFPFLILQIYRLIDACIQALLRALRGNPPRPAIAPVVPGPPPGRQRVRNNVASRTSRPAPGSNPIVLGYSPSARSPALDTSIDEPRRSSVSSFYSANEQEHISTSNERRTFVPTSENVCPICIENVSSSHASALRCAHVFHDACISAWLARSSDPACPVCRSGIS